MEGLRLPPGLTPRQRDNPHMAVHHGAQSISVLERSFARSSLEEVRYWEQTGVIDDALSGKAPSRRDYTCSLMDNLLQNRYHTWFHEQDEWDAILKKLWDAGASKHTHLHAIWLRALPGHWLFDVMLDAGVSPFSPGMSPSAAKIVMDTFAWCHPRPNRSRSLIARATETDASTLASQVDRCIRFPTASATDLSRLLASVVYQGLTCVEDQPWMAWGRDLLDRGADPFSEFSRPIQALAQAGPGSEPITRYELRDMHPSLDIDRSKPPTPEEISLSLASRAKRDEDWTRKSAQWLDMLLSAPSCQDLKDRDLSSDTWSRLLSQVNAVSLCAKLITAGVPAPWAPHDNSRVWPTDVLGHGGIRDILMLERLVAVVSAHGATPPAQWLEKVQDKYVGGYVYRNFENLPFDSRVDDYSTSPSRRKKREVVLDPGCLRQRLSHREWKALLALSSWAPGQPVPDALFPVLAHLPANPGPSGIDADISFLAGSGLIGQALQPTQPTHPPTTQLHRLDWTRYEKWFEGWMQDDAIFTKTIQADPQSHWPMTALATQIAIYRHDQATRQKWISRLKEDFPEKCEAVLTGIFIDKTAKDHSLNQLVEYRREDVLVDLLHAGASPGPEHIARICSSIFPMIFRVTPERQSQVVQFMFDIGMDPVVQGPQLIQAQLQREIQPAPPASLEGCKPALLALLKGGVDASSLDLGRSNGSLHEFVRTNASSISLQGSTMAHGSSPRPRRI